MRKRRRRSPGSKNTGTASHGRITHAPWNWRIRRRRWRGDFAARGHPSYERRATQVSLRNPLPRGGPANEQRDTQVSLRNPLPRGGPANEQRDTQVSLRNPLPRGGPANEQRDTQVSLRNLLSFFVVLAYARTGT